MATITKKRTQKRTLYINLSAVARRFGLSPTQLSQMGRKHPLYAPTIRGIPTGKVTPLGSRITRYHIEHVAIIERVLLGLVDLETAWLEWQVRRNKIGEGR